MADEVVDGAESTRGGLGGDGRRVLGDFLDDVEDSGAAGLDGLAVDIDVPVAVVLQIVRFEFEGKL